MKKYGFSRVWMGLVLAVASATAAPVSAWSSGCDCCDGLGIDVSAEFLWWNVSHSDDLFIGIADTVNSSGSGTAGVAHITSGRTRLFKFDYKPGFRVNLGYQLPCSDWMIGASYTYFHFHHRNTVTAAPGGILWVPTFPVTPGLLSAAASEARAVARVKYDLIDLIAARTTTCDGITNCFYGGVRSLIFDETFHVNYAFNESQGGFIEPGVARWNAYMPAIGITLGYDGIYTICSGWGLRGRFGTSFLGSRVKHYQNWTFNEVPRQNKTRHNEVIWGWDAALGINYDTCWCCRPVTLAFGYEVYDWWNMPRQRYFTNSFYPGVSTTDETGRFTAHGAYVRLGTTF